MQQKIFDAAKALCEESGFAFKRTPTIGHMNLYRDENGYLQLILVEHVELQEWVDLPDKSFHYPDRFTTPFGIFSLTDQEFLDRIEFARTVVATTKNKLKNPS